MHQSPLKTHLSYFEDTYQFTGHATILAVGHDDHGPFLCLDKTLFHPQGGGQPSDQGTLQVGEMMIPIRRVKSVENTIRHYTDKKHTSFIGQEALCTLNQEMRLANARCHTAGHLISNVVESLTCHWKGIKGHHFPGECYVEFTSSDQTDVPPEAQLIQELKKYIQMDAPLMVTQVTEAELKKLCPHITPSKTSGQTIRTVRIGDFPPSPCGGTHVKSLAELGGLKITRIKVKHQTMKISYDMETTVRSPLEL